MTWNCTTKLTFPSCQLQFIAKIEEVSDNEPVIAKIGLQNFLNQRTSLTQGTPPSSELDHVLLTNRKIKSIHIPVHVIKYSETQDMSARASVDSEVQIHCIGLQFIQQNNIPYSQLSTPLKILNADKSANSDGLIKFYSNLFIHIAGLIHKIWFHTINCGNENIILGLPWLSDYNTKINWWKRILEIEHSTNKTHLLNGSWETSLNKISSPTFSELLPSSFKSEGSNSLYLELKIFTSTPETSSLQISLKR